MTHGGTRKGAGRPRGQGPYGEATQPIRLPVSLIKAVMKFVEHKGFQLPLYSSKIPAGFPSPADDYIEKQLDLNEHLIKHPSATFFVRVSGNSMIGAGIHEDDILIVDRSITPTSGKIAVVALDGQLTVKRLKKTGEQLYLLPENQEFKPIEVKEGSEVYIWGIVTNVIHAV
jgi:DNA polymerase V